MSAIVHVGNVLDILPTLDAGSVNCVVTSPPYWGLRDYGTAQWEGGDAGCDHKPRMGASSASSLGGGPPDESPRDRPLTVCQCGARRIDSQLGLEPTPELYVANMVAVFREVRRILRDDGVVFLNLGDSYSTGVGANVSECLNRIVEDATVVFTDALAVAVPAHGVDVAPQDKIAPQGELLSLLAPEWEPIKDRHQDFGEVLHLFASPGYGGLSKPPRAVIVDSTNAQQPMDLVHHVSIVAADLDRQPQAELAVLRTPRAWASEHDERTLAIDEADKPGRAGVVVWHADWDAFAFESLGKSRPDVNVMDKPIALRNGLHAVACSLRNLRVAQASEQQFALGSIGGGVSVSVSDVSHVCFSLPDGSLVPYRTVYTQAIRMSNRNRAKQEMGMPDRVKTAMQEDGWICRSTIIWSKPNPMPESVTDRPTKAHEYLFLLTKSARYWYDAEAIAEPVLATNVHDATGPGYFAPGQTPQTGSRKTKVPGGWDTAPGAHATIHREGRTEATYQEAAPRTTRNRRTVWTIATQPYPGAHFATYPEKLVEPCVMAGCPAQVCSECGAPWERVTERTPMVVAPTPKREAWQESDEHARTQMGGTMKEPATSRTLGWQPTCACDAGTIPGTAADFFAGSGTTGAVACRLGRNFVGCELSPEYAEMAERRIAPHRDQMQLVVT